MSPIWSDYSLLICTNATLDLYLDAGARCLADQSAIAEQAHQQ